MDGKAFPRTDLIRVPKRGGADPVHSVERGSRLRFFRYGKGVLAELATAMMSMRELVIKHFVEGPDFIGHDGSFDDVREQR